MSKYMLVPVEQLKNWHKRINTIAAEDAFNVADEMESMLAAPPAVQGEPVAWIRKWSLDGEKPTKERNKNGRMAYPMKYKLHEVTRNRCLLDDVSLYTAPQPVEQQDNVPDGWRSRFLKLMGEIQSELDDSSDDPIPLELWSLWRELLDTAPQPAEQQPAPEVAMLVEALESLMKGYASLLEGGIDRITHLSGDCDLIPDMLRNAREALATYREQGGGK